MNYLKLVNCPVRGLFPEKKDRAIDWEAAGFNPTEILRGQVYGLIAGGEHVTLYPIDDEARLLASGIIDRVNSNSNPADTAGIVDETEFAALKIQIEAARA